MTDPTQEERRGPLDGFSPTSKVHVHLCSLTAQFNLAQRQAAFLETSKLTPDEKDILDRAKVDLRIVRSAIMRCRKRLSESRILDAHDALSPAEVFLKDFYNDLRDHNLSVGPAPAEGRSDA